MALSPTWYDVLGISRDASPEEIKAAWRQATDRFEPGSGGQFRTFSEAADVLLDPEKRRAYDATLEPLETREPEVAPPAAADPVLLEKGDRPAEVEAEAGPETETLPEDAADEPPASVSRGLAVAGIALAVVLALVVTLGVVLGIKVHQRAGVLDARTEAPAAAERALKVLFSYDYRHLADERKQMGAYLTPKFAPQYLRLFDLLSKQKDGSAGPAIQTKTVVTATTVGSAVVDAEDGSARVLLFVNLLSKKGDQTPTLFENRVAMTMQKDGDRWLVAKVDTY